MWKKSFWASKLLAAIVLLAMWLTGCAGEPEKPAGITFTDALGRTVTVAERPQEVAALLGSFADVWLLSGGSLCAAAEDAWEDFDLPLDGAVNLGGAHSPNLEMLLAADPDFVLASASTASHVEMGAVLERAGIPVAYFNVDCFDDYLAMLEICTDITGRKDLYQQNGLAVQAQIQELKNTLEAEDLPREQRTVLLLRASSGFVKAKGSSGTILGEMLRDLGCINIADSDSTLLENLSAESVIRQEPYRIFVVTMGNDTQKAVENLDRMLRQGPWGTLEAVRENRLHIMDRRMFHIKPNAKWAQAYEELCQILRGK